MNICEIKMLPKGNEISELIISNMPKHNEIAFILDSSKVIGGNTFEFYQYVKEHHQDVKVYGDADNLNVIQLHSIILSLGTVFATTVAVPIALNLISNYLQKKIDQYGSNDIELNVSIVKEDTNGSLSEIKISGKADDVLKAIEKIKENNI
ncbi:UNVERIFIED_CONTAM: hypothetical protein I5919_19670 [Aeromonas hydrophila]